MKIALILTVVPFDTVSAVAPGGFVPCEGTGCSLCHLVSMINVIIVWLFGIIFIMFGVIATIAGFGLVTSGGNQTALDAAKTKLSNAIIGLIIVMAAWLLIDTIMKGLMKGAEGSIEGWGPWTDVQCQIQTEAIEGVAGGAGGAGGSGGGAGGAGGCTGGDCVPLSVTCKDSSSCGIAPGLEDQFNNFATQAAAVAPGSRITEAYPPTVVHQSQCHNNGTCVDYGTAGGMSASEINAVAAAARANGLRPVYEVKTPEERQALIDQGANAGDIIVVSQITAPHFSIYAN